MEEQLHVLASAVESLAAQSMMLDVNSAPDMESFLGGIKDFRIKSQSGGLAVFDEIAALFEGYVSRAARDDASRVMDIIAFGISVLQDIIRDLEQGVAVARSPENVRHAFEQVLRNVQVEDVRLSAAQSAEIPEFITNTRTLLADIENALLVLEKDAGDRDTLNAVFRAFHTVKGEAGLLGIMRLAELSHGVESLLQRFRDGTMQVDTSIVSLLLQCVDAVRAMTDLLEKDLSLVETFDISALKEQLGAVSVSPSPKPAVAAPPEAVMTGKPVEAAAAGYVCKVPQIDLAENKDLICEFIGESQDHLAAAEDSLLALENNPDNAEDVNKIFRAFHTIKGVASFLNLDDIRTLTHETETMMDMVRKSTLKLNSSIVDAILAAIDATRKLLVLLNEQVSQNGVLASAYYDVSAVISRVRAITRGAVPEPPKGPGDGHLLGEVLLQQPAVDPQQLKDALTAQQGPDAGKRIGEILVEKGVATTAQVEKALESQHKEPATVIDQTIKIAVAKLDSLIDMVGELVITGTQVTQNQLIQRIDDNRFVKDLGQLSRIIRDVQDISMAMRLVPIRPVFQKMLRLVRDLSKKAGKEVEARLSGEETEMDKNITDLISDPLMHMVRNAVDHGIESPDARAAAGKQRQGTVELSAGHRGGNIVIEIRDDGGGLNKEKILKKAREKGLVRADETLPESRIFSLIFEPGFSTADKITDISGRGVGMDVVRKNIDMLRGKVEIVSEEGKGSVFTIKLPLTLAIIDGIIFSVGEERYIVPVASVYEFFSPKEADITRISGKGEMIRFHDNLFQLIRLDRHFKIAAQYRSIEEATVCLVDSDYGQVCLLVDKVIGQQQVVIKSLGERLKDVKGVSGGTILGDGKVGLIVDVNGIIEYFRES